MPPKAADSRRPSPDGGLRLCTVPADRAASYRAAGYWSANLTPCFRCRRWPDCLQPDAGDRPGRRPQLRRTRPAGRPGVAALHGLGITPGDRYYYKRLPVCAVPVRVIAGRGAIPAMCLVTAPPNWATSPPSARPPGWWSPMWPAGSTIGRWRANLLPITPPCAMSSMAISNHLCRAQLCQAAHRFAGTAGRFRIASAGCWSRRHHWHAQTHSTHPDDRLQRDGRCRTLSA